MNADTSPLLSEVADVEESLLELDAALYNYDATLQALGHNLDDPLRRADFEQARDDVKDAKRVLREARAALRERQGEFARLDAALGERADVRNLRARMEILGFGGDDFGLDARPKT